MRYSYKVFVIGLCAVLTASAAQATTVSPNAPLDEGQAAQPLLLLLDSGPGGLPLGGGPLSIPGDASLDGVVNVGDLAILASNWQNSGMSWIQADFNGDTLVNVGDLAILSGNWGATGSPPHTPEPVTVVSVLLGVGALSRYVRRRRVLS